MRATQGYPTVAYRAFASTFLYSLGNTFTNFPASSCQLPSRKAADLAAGQLHVLPEQRLNLVLVVSVERVELHHFGVAVLGEGAVGVVNPGDAAAHAGGEVAARLAQDEGAAAGHVLAAVVAHAFHHGGGAGVAHGEPLAGLPAHEQRAGGGPVQRHVADDDVLLGHEAWRRHRGKWPAAPRSGPCPRSRWPRLRARTTGPPR